MGCVLQTVLVPKLREYIEDVLLNCYNNNQALSNQVYGSQQRRDGGNYTFNYKNINQNGIMHPNAPAQWNYSVASHHDFAKLYLQPHMVKFSSITDESFDASAALSVMKCCFSFSQGLRRTADIVRNSVRNPWGHCNLTEWDANKFIDCFQQMSDLVKKLNLPVADEQGLLDEIKQWGKDGNYRFCQYFVSLHVHWFS